MLKKIERIEIEMHAGGCGGVANIYVTIFRPLFVVFCVSFNWHST